VTDTGGPALPPGPVGRLASALAADDANLDSWARTLSGAFGEVLPAGTLEVARERKLADRVAGKPGEICMIRVRFGELVLELAAGRAAVVGTVVREVHGITIRRRTLTLDEWRALFAAEITRLAAGKASLRQAIERLLGAPWPTG